MIDDKLMRETLRATGLKTKREVVEEALRTLLRLRSHLVDSSVWIDYFKGTVITQTDNLDGLLGRELLAIGDLILIEVLQGLDNERDFNDALRILTSLTFVELSGQAIPVQAAKNFRALRKLGVTVRKTIDTAVIVTPS